MKIDDKPDFTSPDSASVSPDAQLLRSLEFDARIYIDEIADLEMEEAQGIALLKIIYELMQGFVELGQTVDICGQLFGEGNEVLLPGDGERLDSSDTLKTRAPDNGDEGDAVA